jgi:RNA polymerase sigma-70 factor (ECF subfamily)
MAENLGETWDWPVIRARCVREARRVVRGHDDVEEVVQEALARAWGARSSCRTPEAPLPWCLQITRNEALRLISRRRAEPVEPEDELADQRSLGESDRVLVRLDIGRALGELPPAERLLVSLRYKGDYSHPEIAAKLGIPEATARVRLHRAHKRLKTLLDVPV